MKKVYSLILTSLFISFSAQEKDNCNDIMNRWNGWDVYKKPSIESVKKCLSKDERKIRVEITNRGDYNDLIQVLYIGFTKVNNGDFFQILKYSENTPNVVIDETYDKVNWRAEGGIIDSRTTHISQSYTGPEDAPNIPLKEIEVYETTAPVLSGILRIMGTYRKDFDHRNQTNLTKLIKVYSDNKLIVSKEYSFEEVGKTGGITLEFSAVEK